VVKNLIKGYQTKGYKTIQWNATNNEDHPVSSGIYFYTIRSDEFNETKKIIFMK